MGSKVSSQEYFEHASAVAEFIVAATALEQDRANSSLKRDVARAAGRASQAAALGHGKVVVRNPPALGGNTVEYDPIVNWNTPSPFREPLREALDIAPQIQATLEALGKRAVREERSFAGRVATVFGFAGHVRRILADRGHSVAYQRTGFWTAVLAQVVAGVALAGAVGLAGAMLT